MTSIVRRAAAAILSAISASPTAVALSTVLIAAAAAIFAPPIGAKEAPPPAQPTVVLVHGAFAESSSWEDVVARLLAKGLPVIAAANPLRGVRSDASYIASIVDSIPGPVILVGHSYGGSVITNTAVARSNVKALVFVAAFAPDAGETAFALSGKYPGSTLGPALGPPVTLADGGKDLYIQQARYHDQFAADLPVRVTALLAATQRPIAEAAGNEPSGPPAWKRIPSWFIYGTADKNIPPALQTFMAERAGAKQTVAVDGASHLVMASHPDQVVQLILDAAGRSAP